MALILESDLNSYIDDTSVNPTKAIIVGAAEQVVIDYLGYDPTSATRSYSFLASRLRLSSMANRFLPRMAGSLKLWQNEIYPSEAR